MIIIMLFLLTDSPQKLKLQKIDGTFNNSLLSELEFCSATNTFAFLLKTQKNNSSASDWLGNTNLVLKRMLELVLKIPPLKKILKF